MIKRLASPHVGTILEEEFLKPYDISKYKLAKDIGTQQTTISMIISGERSVSVQMSIKLARYFNNSPQFWLNLQNNYDIELELSVNSDKYKHIPKYDSLYTI